MKRTAIVVDDEPITRMDLAGILTEAGFDVAGQGGDGFDAIELSRRHNPSLILMDIKMPTFDGLGAAASIMKEEPASCIVLLTAFHDREFIDQANQIGVSGYLVKPIDEHSLLSTIEIALAQSRRLRGMKDYSEEMRRKFEDKSMVDRAKAIVAARDGITEAEAYGSIRKISMDKRIPMPEAARMIVEASRNRQVLDEAKELLMGKYNMTEKAAYKKVKGISQRDNTTIEAAAQYLLRQERDKH